jgi:hypothetical protein
MDGLPLPALPAAPLLAPIAIEIESEPGPTVDNSGNSPTPPLTARPVLCLEHDRWQLLAEAIDQNLERQTTWVRPIVLAEYADQLAREASDRPQTIYSEEYAVDLVLPSALFRAAFDLELLNLLALKPHCLPSIEPAAGRMVFQKFVRLLFARKLPPMRISGPPEVR